MDDNNKPLIRNLQLLKLGKHIQHLRESKNIAKQEMAYMLDISQHLYELLERGQMNPTNLTPTDRQKLANILGASENELFFHQTKVRV